MPRDVDVAGLGRRGTELTGEMGLDDSGRPLGADERCLVDGNAAAALDPGRNRVDLAAAGNQVSITAVQHFIDHVLHPRSPALHLGDDEDVFGARLILLGPREGLRVQLPAGPATPL